MRTTTALLLSVAFAGACSDGSRGELFPVKPECTGDPIAAYMGTQPQVISKLAIGSREDGFDLDRDGEPDNKLAAVSSIAQSAIDDALNNYEIVIPIEFFDTTGSTEDDECIKFAIYLGDYVKDVDGDGEDPYVDGGDCNDTAGAGATISKKLPEIADNAIDDDCDALADEDAQNVACTTGQCMMDRDGDGQSIAAGDCDDTRMAVKKGGVEICGDGLDNDCDGVADRTGGAMSTACSPFDTANLADIPLDPLSFVNNQPVIVFDSGSIEKGVLVAGPSIFSVNVPVTDGISLDLRITGATIEAAVEQQGGKMVMRGGRLGGVIDAKTADTIRGLEVDQIGLTPENSLLDATFANLLGPLLALPKHKNQTKYPGCRTPDIDVDQDGHEAYCDSDPDVDPKVVDICVDGDGTEFRDVLGEDGMPIMNCTEVLLANGKHRFVDGISVELNFETTPIKAIKPPR